MANTSLISKESWQDWPSDSSESKYTDAGKLQGLGENLLAEIFGGSTTGGEDYDIDIGDERWEVKESTSRSAAIRAGSTGRAAWLECYYKIVGALTQVETFLQTFNKYTSHVDSPHLRDDTVLSVTKIAELDALLREPVVEGEISGARMKLLMELFERVAVVRSSLRRAALSSPSISGVLIGDVPHAVDAAAASQIAGILSLSRVRALDPEVDPRPGLAAILSDELFDSPTALLKLFQDRLAPSKVFGHVNGMFIVNRGGYFAIPSSKFDSYLKLVRLSQCTPRYEFTGGFRVKPRKVR